MPVTGASRPPIEWYVPPLWCYPAAANRTAILIWCTRVLTHPRHRLVPLLAGSHDVRRTPHLPRARRVAAADERFCISAMTCMRVVKGLRPVGCAPCTRLVPLLAGGGGAGAQQCWLIHTNLTVWIVRWPDSRAWFSSGFMGTDFASFAMIPAPIAMPRLHHLRGRGTLRRVVAVERRTVAARVR